MSDDETDVKKHISSRSTWIRLIYIILYGIAYRVASLVLIAITILQFVKALLTGTPFPRLQAFGGSLADYNRELVSFLSFESDVKPFPIGPWPPQKNPPPPSSGNEDKDDEVIVVADKPAAKKPRATDAKKKPDDDNGTADA